MNYSEKLKSHRGHSISCVSYGDWDNPQDICIECEDCNEVLFSAEDLDADNTAKWISVDDVVNSRILFLFDHMYSLLYTGKIPESKDLVEKTDVWMTENNEKIGALAKARGDLFSSEREINALGLALNL